MSGALLSDDERLGLPTEIEVVGEHLILLDIASDSVVHVFDRMGGDHIRSFGRIGEGPGEFAAAWSIDPVAGKESEFWIFDFDLRRLTHVDLNKHFRAGRFAGSRSITLASDAAILDPIWVDTTLVGVGFFPSGRLAYYNSNGRLNRTAGEVPPGDPTVPAHVRQHAYQSTLKADPERLRLVLATRHADQIEIYHADGTVLAHPKPLFAFHPLYAIRNRGDRLAMATGADLRFGYIDLATTRAHIIGLFSGRTREAFPGEANFGEYIHIFDWAGALVHVLHMEHPAIAIAVSSDGESLYSIAHEPKPSIFVYDLGVIGRKGRNDGG